MAAACATVDPTMTPDEAPKMSPGLPIIPFVDTLARSAGNLNRLERPKLTTKRSHRLTNRRSRSHRESAEPLVQIRRVLQTFLGRNQDLVAISQDFFAVAVGLSPAFVLYDYNLDMAETNRMGYQLSQIISTTEVVLLLDQGSNRLIIAETNSLTRRAITYATDETFFMPWDADNANDIIAPKDINFMVSVCPRLVDILGRSDSQVISSDELLWAGDDCSGQLTTLAEWLQRFPVCYIGYASAPTPPSSPRVGGMSWSLQAQFDGKDFGNDHRLAPCKVRASIFPFDSLTRESNTARPDGSRNLSLAAMQDSMQSYYFERLNDSEMAAQVWDGVIVEANLC